MLDPKCVSVRPTMPLGREAVEHVHVSRSKPHVFGDGASYCGLGDTLHLPSLRPSEGGGRGTLDSATDRHRQTMPIPKEGIRCLRRAPLGRLAMYRRAERRRLGDLVRMLVAAGRARGHDLHLASL